MKNKYVKIIVTCIIIMGLYVGFDIFTHSTAERVIRTDLFFKGYFLEAFKTEISQRPISDSQYGTKYICTNPAIGPDSYDIDKKHKYFEKFEYWYIGPGTGGG